MRKKLGPEIKRAIEARGQSMRSMADALGLYVNSLRSWIRRNTFPAGALLKVARYLELAEDLESLGAKYEFYLAGTRRTSLMKLTELEHQERVDLQDVLSALSSSAVGLLNKPDVERAETRLLFRALGKGSLYVCGFLDALPIELIGAGWASVGDDVARAVARGTQLVYLVPSEKLCSELQESGLHSVISRKSAEHAIQDLGRRVEERLGAKYGAGASKEIALVDWDAPVFVVPGAEWIFVSGRSSSDTSNKLFMRMRLQGEGKTGIALLSADEEMTTQFLSVLVSQLERSGGEYTLNVLL